MHRQGPVTTVATALVVGGTRFIGRPTVDALLAHADEVTLFDWGEHPNPFADDDRVDHVEGDRGGSGARPPDRADEERMLGGLEAI